MRARRALGKSPRYVAWRLGQEVGHQLRRARLRAARGDRGPLSRSAILREQGGSVLALTAEAAPALGAWAAAAEHIRGDVELRTDLLRRAGAAERRIVELFGDEPVEAGVPPRWDLDVRSGFGWPPDHYLRIDYRNVGRPSDVKVTWELSRLRHLVYLAQAVAVTRDARWDVAIDADVRDWHRANPLGHSVNWTCAMEVALRAVNLICVDAMLLTQAPTYRTRRLLVSSLYQHGWFLRRNLEISDVNGNHFVANAVGLIWLGRYFGAFRAGPRWFELGCEMLERAAKEQVFSDGVDHEGSLPRYLLVTELFLLGRHAAGERLALLDGTLRAMLDAPCAFTHPGGRVPDIGDDDGGRAAAFCDAPSQDARRVLALGAALLGHRWAAAVAAGGAWDDALWLLGPCAVDDARGGAAPAERRRHFPDTGLLVLGDGADRIVVDAGPVGFRGRGGHGHLDAMSFEAVLGGEVAIRDSGTGSYTGDTILRELLRGAYAHTVVVIDGRPYAQLGGAAELWRIAGDSVPSLLQAPGRTGQQIAQIEQLLPAAGGQGLHRRTIEWQPGLLRWTDEVTAPAGALVEHLVQLPAGSEMRRDGIANQHFRYQLDASMPHSLVLQPAPWSPQYGSIHEACRAVVSYRAREQASVVKWTVLAAT